MLTALVRSYRDVFTGLPRTVWVLAGCLFVNRLGMMVLPFLELYLTDERRFSVELAGRLVGLYGLGAIAGVSAGGWLTDRFGPWRVQVLSLVGNALALLCLWRARATIEVGVAVFCTSLAGDAFRPANGAAIAAAVGEGARARAFSLMSLAINLGLCFGLPLAGILAKHDFDWLFWIDSLTALLAALVLWKWAERPARSAAAHEPRSGASPWRDGPFVLAVLMQCLTATVLFQFFGGLPLFLQRDIGLDEAQIGLAFALNTVVAAVCGMPAVRWVEGRPEVRWLGIGAFLVCIGYGINALAGGVGVAVLSILVWSAGEIFYFPLGAALASRRAPPGAIGRYMSVHHLGLAVALVLAPWLGTLLYARGGPRVLWGSCAAAGLLVGATFEWLQRRGSLSR